MVKKNFLFVLFCLFSLVVNAQVIADGVYVIKSSINPNYVIDLSGSNVFNGNNIQLWERNNTNAQKWIIENVNGAVIIKSSINKSFVIDLNRSNAASGTNIQLWESNGTKAQRWYVRQKGNYFEFHSAVNSSYVIDLNSSNIASGENIQCWESNNTNAQRWILERVEESNGNSYVPAPLYPQTPQSQIEKCTRAESEHLKTTSLRCLRWKWPLYAVPWYRVFLRQFHFSVFHSSTSTPQSDILECGSGSWEDDFKVKSEK